MGKPLGWDRRRPRPVDKSRTRPPSRAGTSRRRPGGRRTAWRETPLPRPDRRRDSNRNAPPTICVRWVPSCGRWLTGAIRVARVRWWFAGART
ncbi:hypothetical protein E1165_27330 [Micromonospora sp. KC723]|nr:hypothetical protein E1165_27330 [Micromonospora sp. KC723]